VTNASPNAGVDFNISCHFFQQLMSRRRGTSLRNMQARRRTLSLYFGAAPEPATSTINSRCPLVQPLTITPRVIQCHGLLPTGAFRNSASRMAVSFFLVSSGKPRLPADISSSRNACESTSRCTLSSETGMPESDIGARLPHMGNNADNDPHRQKWPHAIGDPARS
jgi:hypothetical protein